MSHTQQQTADAGGASLFHRLSHTPLRDALRGRISGRLDYERIVRGSGLNAPIDALVLSVVRKTRLRRIEKADVTRELVSHFRSGLAAGTSSDELIESFGDPKQAALLIRRAVKRRRPMVMSAMIHSMKGVAALVLILAMAYVLMAIRLYSGHPTISHNYLADLNSNAESVPESDRAWPLYREALIVLRAEFGERLNIAFHPEEDDWQRTVEVIERHPEAINTLRQAAAMPGLGYVAGFSHDPADSALWPDEEYPADPNARFDFESKSIIEVQLPQLGSLRFVGKLLTADAYRAAEHGDGTAAANDLVALVRTAEHARETPTLISDLVGVSLLALACETTTRLLQESPQLLTEADSLRLAHELASYGGRDGVTVRIGHERDWFRDLVQRMYTDDGNGNGHLTDEGTALLMSWSDASFAVPDPDLRAVLTGAGLSFVIADRKDTLNEYDRIMNHMIAQFQQPMWERGRAGTSYQSLEKLVTNRVWSFKYLLPRLMMPALDRAAINGDLAAIRRDGALVALALHVYRLRHDGHWPATLEDLVPDLLARVPIDRYDGQPLRYQVIDGEAVVYCLGVDCDDDGGMVPEEESRVAEWLPPADRNTNSSRFVDGDWVLWSSSSSQQGD
ncbi:MAG: hypothetical protein D8M59_01465 [Planctomycetes bacterium]|nr:hypothetical protein [Planctomycetota bacterium]NOG54610.1 hypothetical protein [Planctomycetota bacterium]